MAKLSVSRLFEAAPVLESFAKAKIEGMEGFVSYLSDFSENTIRALREVRKVGNKAFHAFDLSLSK